ncbi:MAG: DUF1844 domain-containing protein [Bacteroidota bacterium]
MTDQEKNQLLFMQIIMMFHTLTMQQLGKIKNPITDKPERDLSGAQSSIDLLDMLKEKTKGNLSQDEERFLVNSLKELKLNYVDEAAKPEPPPKPEEGKPSA